MIHIIKRIALSFLFVFVGGLMRAQAQSRLTPGSLVEYGGKGVLANYYNKIDSLLLPSSYYKFAHIVLPSFSPEYSLFGTKDNTLILRKAEQNIWYNYLENKNVSIKEYQLQVSPEIFDTISNLIESAVLTSSYLYDELGNDGTTFVFISGRYSAKCWSPAPKSNCGKLVAITDTICKAVEQNDSTLIEDNLSNIT